MVDASVIAQTLQKTYEGRVERIFAVLPGGQEGAQAVASIMNVSVETFDSDTYKFSRTPSKDEPAIFIGPSELYKEVYAYMSDWHRLWAFHAS